MQHKPRRSDHPPTGEPGGVPGGAPGDSPGPEPGHGETSPPAEGPAPSPAAPNINPRLRGRPGPSVPEPEAWVRGILGGDRVLLSRAITLVESTRAEHQALAARILEGCLPHAGRSVRVGITGVPGVGKSTFIEALGGRLTAQGHRLAVLAIDPSSTRTHGSILGDKTRMPRLAADPHAFIRPSPTAGSLGGVARQTRETMLLCEAAGFDLVFVETVGVGQSEVAVHGLVDFFLLLVLPGAGDELQGIKRGIVEMADALAVTKADGANLAQARIARGAYRNALRLFPPPPSGWTPQVRTCSALTGEGLDEVWAMVRAYVEATQANGYFEARRREQSQYWMHQAVQDQLRRDFLAHPGVRAARAALEAEVAAGRLSPFAGARRLLAVYRGAPDPPEQP